MKLEKVQDTHEPLKTEYEFLRQVLIILCIVQYAMIQVSKKHLQKLKMMNSVHDRAEKKRRKLEPICLKQTKL